MFALSLKPEIAAINLKKKTRFEHSGVASCVTVSQVAFVEVELNETGDMEGRSFITSAR
jgi:hypothetical protein